MMRTGLIVILSTVILAVCAYTYSDETNLHTALTTGYDVTVRPETKTELGLHFGLMSITELDIVNQEFALTGFVVSHWNDSRLMWQPAGFGGITNTKMKFSTVWTPSLLINNAADGIKVINDDSNLESIYLFLRSDGEARWLTPVNARTQCSVNIRTYPFDSQTCNIILSTWMFSVTEMVFYKMQDTINQDVYIENGEWDITSTSVTNVIRDMMAFPVSSVVFTVNLKRKYSYYVITMLLPVTVLAFLAPFQFLLPIESGEQNGYSLTILLSLSVVMTLVAESIPPTATYISILSVYLLVTYILCSWQTVHVVLMTRFHCFGGRGCQLGYRTNRIAHFMAKLTFYRRKDENNTSQESAHTSGPDMLVDTNLKHGSKTIAWGKGKTTSTDDCISQHSQDEILYTYEEFVHMFNNLNFFLYFFLTCILTCIFMLLLKL